jgi:hypothetical protein
MPSKGIRKITMSQQMLDDLREYAWAHRLSVSQVIRDVMRNIQEHPLVYEAWHEDLEGPTAVITVYVTDDLWEPVKEKLYWERLSIATALRAGIASVLSGKKVPAELP